MKTYLDCVPCFVRQALRSARTVTDAPAIHEQVLRAVLAATASIDLSQCPPAMGRQIHQFVHQALGEPDPYRAIKQRFNAHAASLLGGLRQRIAAADDPLEAAVRVAIAGNIIDFGTPGEVDDQRLATAIERCFQAEIDRSTVAALHEAATGAGSVVLLADNAGEIVLDRLLLEQLRALRSGLELTVVVRGAPVINDATLKDAEQAGLADIARVIDSGDGSPGTILSRCSAAFRQAFDAADLVIAKGQGNYESLADSTPREVFFLFQAKCEVVARHIGCARGTPVICRAQR